MIQHRYLPFIAGIFTASLVISNTIATKIFTIGPITISAGVILVPISYVFGDILTEVYGYSASRKVIWSGVIAQILMVLSYTVAGMLPPAVFWTYQSSFEEILNPVPRIALASVCALFAGEFSNSYILAKLKVRMAGEHLSVRYVLSTLVGQFFDTAVFISIAFIGLFEILDIVELIFWGWFLKVLWEVIALPVSIPLTNRLKKAEGIDHFDKETNFNPFIIVK